MHLIDRLFTTLNGNLGQRAPRYSVLSALTLACMVAPAWGQVSPSAATANTQLLPVVASGPKWKELTPNQQTALAPLAASWESLEPARKRKWLSVAQTYPQLAPAEQAKLQGRMAEWAALSPRERAVARFNFAESKKLPASDRAANWDAYKALPPEDRQKFVAQAASAPKSAALAPKRPGVDKVTPVPVTRRTSTTDRERAEAVAPSLDRKTLLPQAPKPVKAAASSPAK